MTDLRERVARAETEELTRGLAGELLKRLHETIGFDAPHFDDVDQTIVIEALKRLAASDAAIAATKLEREVYVYSDGKLTVEMRLVPLTTKGKPCCSICETPLDIPGRLWTRNCGGDCLACMADAGDPECVAGMAAIYNTENPHA